MHLLSLPLLTPTAHKSFRPTFPRSTLVIESTAIVCLSLTLLPFAHINSFRREYTAIFPGSSAAFGSIHFSLQGYTPRIVIYASDFRCEPRDIALLLIVPKLVNQLVSNAQLVVHSFVVAKHPNKVLPVGDRLKNHAQRLHHAILHRVVSTSQRLFDPTSTIGPEFERKSPRRGTSSDLHCRRVRARPPQTPPRSHRTFCSRAATPHKAPLRRRFR